MSEEEMLREVLSAAVATRVRAQAIQFEIGRKHRRGLESEARFNEALETYRNAQADQEAAERPLLAFYRGLVK